MGRPNINIGVGGTDQNPQATYKTVILKSTIPLATQVNEPNCKYVIKWDFTLDRDITIPQNCILEFDGGSVSGGYAITGNNTIIQAGLVRIFGIDITLAGTWNVSEAYPEWFGAVGDGVNDDTAALRKVVLSFSNYQAPNCHIIKITKSFRIAETLISESHLTIPSLWVDIEGRVLNAHNAYNSTTKCGGLKLDVGVDLFVGIGIRCSTFKNLVITSNDILQTENIGNSGSIFKDCDIRSSSLSNCRIHGIGSVFYDCDVNQLSKVSNNTITACHNFAHCSQSSKVYDFVDSVIEGNYISGNTRESSEDNDCFEWPQWNGSVVFNNHIDYYRCIYNPTQSTVGLVPLLVNSIANRYEAFKYLYNAEATSPVTTTKNNNIIKSIQDEFNHTERPQDAFLNSMPAFTYEYNSQVYDVPKNIIWVGGGYSKNISFVNPIFSQNIGNILYISSGVVSQADRCQIINPVSTLNNTHLTISRSVAQNVYLRAALDVPEVYFDFCYLEQSLPSEPAKYMLGEKVMVSNTVYKRTYNPYKKSAYWKEENSQSQMPCTGSAVIRASIEANLTADDAGLIFFNTTDKKPLWWDGAAWRDATGTIIS